MYIDVCRAISISRCVWNRHSFCRVSQSPSAESLSGLRTCFQHGSGWLTRSASSAPHSWGSVVIESPGRQSIAAKGYRSCLPCESTLLSKSSTPVFASQSRGSAGVSDHSFWRLTALRVRTADQAAQSSFHAAAKPWMCSSELARVRWFLMHATDLCSSGHLRADCLPREPDLRPRCKGSSYLEVAYHHGFGGWRMHLEWTLQIATPVPPQELLTPHFGVAGWLLLIIGCRRADWHHEWCLHLSASASV